LGIQQGAVEDLGMNPQFWSGKRVLVTGHTGFKGSWLSLWLQKLGAVVGGYSLPANDQSLFRMAAVQENMQSAEGDICSAPSLHRFFEDFRPEIVLHLAAQSLVRASYDFPLETFQVNVMGTIQVLEAVRRTPTCRVLVNVTSDKCYANKEWVWGYREDDALGGKDPYSSSKACAELVTRAYQSSFFEGTGATRAGVATVRAGNVIGGGDFAKDRIVPDVMAAFRAGRPLQVRNPAAIRPWQHVLEPLSGYLLLAERMWHDPANYQESWNFGPSADDVRTVKWIVERLAAHWGTPVAWRLDESPNRPEAGMLALDSSKARSRLGWSPRWTLDQALQAVCQWYKAYHQGQPIRPLVMQQIASYETAPRSGDVIQHQQPRQTTHD
jgi:CDP-glucose 4,6-dehydratase